MGKAFVLLWPPSRMGWLARDAQLKEIDRYERLSSAPGVLVWSREWTRPGGARWRGRWWRRGDPPRGVRPDGIEDSKLLTPKQRGRPTSASSPAAAVVAKAEPGVHRQAGAAQDATWSCSDGRAGAGAQPEYVLCDGFPVKRHRVPSLGLRKGDVVTAWVAAASIVAKVTRDRIMDRYHRRFPEYGFKTNGLRHRGALGGPGAAGADPDPPPLVHPRAPALSPGGAPGHEEESRRAGRSSTVMSDEEIERYEVERELRLYREYRDVLPMFTYVVETERRFYLANKVELPAQGRGMGRDRDGRRVGVGHAPAGTVRHEGPRPDPRDVNIEELARRDETTTIPDLPPSPEASAPEASAPCRICLSDPAGTVRDGSSSDRPPAPSAKPPQLVTTAIVGIGCSPGTGAAASASSTSSSRAPTLLFCEVKAGGAGASAAGWEAVDGRSGRSPVPGRDLPPDTAAQPGSGALRRRQRPAGVRAISSGRGLRGRLLRPPAGWSRGDRCRRRC